MWRGGRKTVVFKPLGARDAATSSGVAEASFQVRLQTHPGQTYCKGKSGKDSPTPTARPQPTTAKLTNLGDAYRTPTNKRPKPPESLELEIVERPVASGHMLGPQSSDDLRALSTISSSRIWWLWPLDRRRAVGMPALSSTSRCARSDNSRLVCLQYSIAHHLCFVKSPSARDVSSLSGVLLLL